jgi:GNAT superfamily N-acetyltransferase
MSTKIRFVEKLSDEEDKHLFYWNPDVFGLEPYNLEWRLENDWHYLLYEDEQLISHVGIVKHVVTVEERQITVGGIAAVVTRPEAQGKGYAKELMEKATTFICEELSVDFGLLFCRPPLVPYYQKLGWQEIQDTVMIEQPSGKMPLPVSAMFLPCQENSWPAGTVDIGSWPW